MIDPTCMNINKLFFFSSKNGGNEPRINFSIKYYMYANYAFNVLIDNKPFFNQPVKNKQDAYGKLAEMSRNDDYITGSLLGYLYHQKYYKPIGIDL